MCGNFVERHSAHIVSKDSPETMPKLCLSIKFNTRKLGEITVFYPVFDYELLSHKEQSTETASFEGSAVFLFKETYSTN